MFKRFSNEFVNSILPFQFELSFSIPEILNCFINSISLKIASSLDS